MSLASMFKWGKRRSAQPVSAESVSAAAVAPATATVRAPQSAPMPANHGLHGQFARTLQPGSNAGIPDVAEAWAVLEEEMGLVPAGEIALRPECGPGEPAPFSQAVYIDRYAVTNTQFAQFVADGGYDDTDLWPEDVWSNVAQFVDGTGHPGPRYWQQGRPPKGREHHPVVGVCWYEANAYAMWAGKRLPSSVEWERSGTWPTNLEDNSAFVRYPWGNSFDPKKANTASTGIGGTVEVNAFPEGCTPNGVYQLVGNVWEWAGDEYTGPPVREGLRVYIDQLMAEIRGGAFDTYFDHQCTCRFRTGQSLLYRGINVGFRCAVSADELRRPADAAEL
ncbi:MAG: formylglycine-generating enzyme family protein [Planctomycetaceae bacterium]